MVCSPQVEYNQDKILNSSFFITEYENVVNWMTSYTLHVKYDSNLRAVSLLMLQLKFWQTTYQIYSPGGSAFSTIDQDHHHHLFAQNTIKIDNGYVNEQDRKAHCALTSAHNIT